MLTHYTLSNSLISLIAFDSFIQRPTSKYSFCVILTGFEYSGTLGPISHILGQIKRGLYFTFDTQLSFVSWFFGTFGGRRLPAYRFNGAELQRDKFRVSETTGALEYSQTWLRRHKPDKRTRLLLCFLASLPQQISGNLLIVGPRYENEIFLARGLGWRTSEIKALDLLSYSKRINCGDMHKTAYPDQSFDSIVMPWVISYSLQPKVAAKEMTRILKPGGVLVVAVDYVRQLLPKSKESLDILDGKRRLQSQGQFMKLFPEFSVIFEANRHNGENIYMIALQKGFNSKHET
jgi:hypothetical protein